MFERVKTCSIGGPTAALPLRTTVSPDRTDFTIALPLLGSVICVKLFLNLLDSL